VEAIEIALENFLERIPGYSQVARNIARGLHQAVLKGGKPVRKLADLLHGTWLGHPLHPVLTDVTIGAWLYASLMDMVALVTRSKQVEQAADTLAAIGVASAVPTALAGATDYSGIKRGAAPLAVLHALMNVEALLYYSASLFARRNGNRLQATILSELGMGTVLLSAYLGGTLVYKHRVGVNHAPKPSGPREWTPIMSETDLPESQPRRIDVEGAPVLLYRYGGTVYAIGAVCAHAGAPLEEGTFDDRCVQCPWHDSVYDLRDGSVVHGPSTFSQPAYRARILNGQIEIRLAEEGAGAGSS
jgi:nitrite reductase/ring-hydroxylating ferredoxin subunit/uncharacterized membrane protein